MPQGIVNGFDYLNIEAQKYWSFPSSYDHQKKQETLKNMLYSGEYVASEKKDGYWQMVIKDDEKNITMRARSKGVNGWVCKQDWVPHLKEFFDVLPRGTVLIGEVYLPGKTSRTITTILGCGVDKAIERQENSKLRFSVFDVICFHGIHLQDKPIVERIRFLNKIKELVAENDIQFVDVMTYWDEPDAIHENWLRILGEGGEGVVLTKKDSTYDFGKRTAKKTLKLKKELQETIDVFLTGKYKPATKAYTGKDLENWEYWYNEITEEVYFGKALLENIDNQMMTPVTRLWALNYAGAVQIATLIDGKVTPIGWISGVTDEVREKIVQDPNAYKGAVVELQAMEVDNTGEIPTLRHAKIVQWRPDKNWKDCIWR